MYRCDGDGVVASTRIKESNDTRAVTAALSLEGRPAMPIRETAPRRQSQRDTMLPCSGHLYHKNHGAIGQEYAGV